MDRYAYLFVYDDDVGTRDEVEKFLNSRREVLNWYYCLPNRFFLISEETATGLTTIIRDFTEDDGQFLILDTATDRSGWLPKSAWNFLRNREPA